jgi:hypothetical protein
LDATNLDKFEQALVDHTDAQLDAAPAPGPPVTERRA